MILNSTHSLPPLEPSDTVKEKKDNKRLVFSVLGAATIIVVLALFSLPGTTDPVTITDPLSIANVTIIESSDKCEIHFILVNSEGKDFLVDIEMIEWDSISVGPGGISQSGRILRGQEQFFVKANTTEEKIMQSEDVPKFNCFGQKITAEIIKVE